MPDTEDKIPETGPEAVFYALQQLDADKIEAEGRRELASGKRTKRSGAVQKLRIASGLRRNNMSPSDFMIESVPVLPPRFRPFAVQGETLLLGDANVLYKDLMDVRDAHNEERGMFGDRLAGKSRLALYDAVKSVYGYGDAVKPKTKAKDVQGFLKKIVGKTSKFSWMSNKMIAKPVDNVGRSTIIVDPELDMDHIGLPKDLAFKMYAPYIQRRLKQLGMRDAEALRAVKEQTPYAEKALNDVVQERPVWYSRAPQWHRFSINAAFPKIIEAKAIAVPPAPCVGLGADFDGNCITGRSKLLIKFDDTQLGSKSAPSPTHGATLDEKIVKISIDSDGCVVYDGRRMKNTTVTIKTTEGAIVSMPISEMPYLADTLRKDKNGADVYDVPAGVSVLAATPEGGVRWEAVESFTVEDGCSLRRVVTSGKRVVECSANESLAAFNPDGGLQRIKPDDAVRYVTKKDKFGNDVTCLDFAHAVPVVRKFPSETASDGDDRDAMLGWLIGMFVSDGTFDGRLFTYTKADARLRSRMIKCMAELSGDDAIAMGAKTYSEMHDAETNYGIGGMSTKLHVSATAMPEWMRELFADCYDKQGRMDTTKRSCLAKRLPGDVTAYSRKKLLGVLAGIIDGDGSVSVNNSKKTKQVMCSISTSSTYLRDTVKLLFNMLGIGFGYSVTRPKEGRVQRNDNYIIPISTEWLYRNMDELPVTMEYEGLKLLKANPPHCSAKNSTPISYKAMQALKEANHDVVKWKSWDTNLSKAKRGGYALFARDNAQKYARGIMDAIPDWEGRPELACVVKAAFDESIAWEYYASVEEIPTERVYDLGVPGAKVFMLESGLIVYDTINVHVPASDAAVKECREKLLPSSNPFKDRSSGQVMHLPKQEEILGLYTSATSPDNRVYNFASEADALHAIRSGKVPLSANVTINGKG